MSTSKQAREKTLKDIEDSIKREREAEKKAQETRKQAEIQAAEAVKKAQGLSDEVLAIKSRIANLLGEEKTLQDKINAKNKEYLAINTDFTAKLADLEAQKAKWVENNANIKIALENALNKAEIAIKEANDKEMAAQKQLEEANRQKIAQLAERDRLDALRQDLFSQSLILKSTRELLDSRQKQLIESQVRSDKLNSELNKQKQELNTREQLITNKEGDLTNRDKIIQNKEIAQTATAYELEARVAKINDLITIYKLGGKI